MNKVNLLIGIIALTTSCCYIRKLKHVKCIQHREVVYDGPATEYFWQEDYVRIRSINSAGEETEQVIQGEVSCTKTYEKRKDDKKEEQKDYYE